MATRSEQRQSKWDHGNYKHVTYFKGQREWAIGIVASDDALVDPDWQYYAEKPSYLWVEVDIFQYDEWSLSGTVRADGCSNWNDWDGCLHFCGVADTQVFEHAYAAAHKVLNTDSEREHKFFSKGE